MRGERLFSWRTHSYAVGWMLYARLTVLDTSLNPAGYALMNRLTRLIEKLP